jgi:hypothetical protein
MYNVPQRYFLNPASQPQPNFFVGAPVIGSTYLDLQFGALSFSDFLWNDPTPGANRVLHPLHPDADFGEFLDNFAKGASLDLDLDMNIFSFGFRVKSMYFTVDMRSRLNSGMSFSGDLLNLLLIGNEDGRTYNINDMGFFLREHLEVGFGFSTKIGDMFTVGARPKILYGIASISSTQNNVDLFTSHELWDLNSHLELQVAFPGVILPTDANGAIDFSEGDVAFDSTLFGEDMEVSRLIDEATGNKGFGIDLGVHFTPIDELKISASITDLGIIKWRNYTYSADFDADLEFSGIEINSSTISDLLEGGDESDTTGFGRDILDTLLNSFDVSGNSDFFTSGIGTKIYVGASYSLLKSLDVGLLTRFYMPQTGLDWDMMLHVDWHPNNFFEISMNYSPFKGGANTFGLGGTFRLGPFTAYLIADYLAARYTKLMVYNEERDRNMFLGVLPYNQSAFNIRFGMNLVFGWNQKKKLRRDKPMYYSEDY